MTERVVSVPHSGTRTLQQHIYTLNGGEGQMGDDRSGAPKHWHWTLHGLAIARFLVAEAVPGEDRVHIPIRNPFDIADSWERRYGDEVGKTQDIVNDAMLCQIHAIRQHPDLITTHKIEDLPVLRGIGPRPPEWPEPRELLKRPRFTELRRFMNNAFVIEFYREYYSEQELQWL